MKAGADSRAVRFLHLASSQSHGDPVSQDTEYQRNGVRDLMMICEPKRGWRDVLVMARRTKIEFAHGMRHIVQSYPDAEVIHVVLDNLNTHKAASLYEAFSAEEARATARKIEFHYTPKHGSWLNIAEIELAVLSNMCLSQRIPDEAYATPTGRSQCPRTQCQGRTR
jgi:hypothetical protein